MTLSVHQQLLMTGRSGAQAVESPCLSILVPLLVKGLREKKPVIRKTAVIIDNMVKVRGFTGHDDWTDCVNSARCKSEILSGPQLGKLALRGQFTR